MAKPDIDSIQRYVAYVSVGASTVRGLCKGVVSAARTALSGIDLAPFGTDSEPEFRVALNRETRMVKKHLPKCGAYWGVARKVLNIFLRGALYNIYLNRQYGLSRSDAFFEIPLDRICATAIRADSTIPLPAWRGVKRVDWRMNAEYQHAAKEIAQSKDTVRVHLDAIYFGGR